MSTTAAASGKGLGSAMLRQRAQLATAGVSKVKASSSPDVRAVSTAGPRSREPDLPSKLRLLDVYLGGAEGAGRPFHAATGAPDSVKPNLPLASGLMLISEFLIPS
jgi:hypothetical protein